MRQKTIRLSGDDGYSVNGDVVEYLYYTDDHDTGPGTEGKMEWRPTFIRIGATVVLVSDTDVSPNAIRAGNSVPRFRLVPDTGGVGGNSNPKIQRYHGWRGTTNDHSVDAHGRREVVSVRTLKNGDVAVTVGPDLDPEEA